MKITLLQSSFSTDNPRVKDGQQTYHPILTKEEHIAMLGELSGGKAQPTVIELDELLALYDADVLPSPRSVRAAKSRPTDHEDTNGQQRYQRNKSFSPAVMFSNSAPTRREDKMEFNGLMCFDYDVHDEDDTTAEEVLRRGFDAGALLGGYSIGGKGCFLVFTAALSVTLDNYREQYALAMGWLTKKIGAHFEFDKSCSDPTRLRYLPLKKPMMGPNPQRMPFFSKSLERLESMVEGDRHHTAISECGKLHSQGLSRAEAKAAISQSWDKGEDELERILDYVYSKDTWNGLSYSGVFSTRQEAVDALWDRWFSLYRALKGPNCRWYRLKTGEIAEGCEVSGLYKTLNKYRDFKGVVQTISFQQVVNEHNASDMFVETTTRYDLPVGAICPDGRVNARPRTYIEQKPSRPMNDAEKALIEKIKAYYIVRATPDEMMWLTSWLVHLCDLSQVTRRSSKVPLLQGLKGSGKGTILGALPRAILGPGACCFINGWLPERFAPERLHSARYLWIDEALVKGKTSSDREAALAMFKNLVTEDTCSLEYKGITARSYDIQLEVALSTNTEKFPEELISDRRTVSLGFDQNADEPPDEVFSALHGKSNLDPVILAHGLFNMLKELNYQPDIYRQMINTERKRELTDMAVETLLFEHVVILLGEREKATAKELAEDLRTRWPREHGTVTAQSVGYALKPAINAGKIKKGRSNGCCVYSV